MSAAKNCLVRGSMHTLGDTRMDTTQQQAQPAALPSHALMDMQGYHMPWLLPFLRPETVQMWLSCCEPARQLLSGNWPAVCNPLVAAPSPLLTSTTPSACLPHLAALTAQLPRLGHSDLQSTRQEVRLSASAAGSSDCRRLLSHDQSSDSCLCCQAGDPEQFAGACHTC